MEAHSPMQMVDTSHLMKFMVSKMPRPAVTEPPGELMYREMSLSGSVALQVQKLGHDRVGHVVVDLLAQEDDAVVEQAAVDVVAALAARRLLDDVGDEGVARADQAALHTFDAHRYLAFVNSGRSQRPSHSSRSYCHTSVRNASPNAKRPYGSMEDRMETRGVQVRNTSKNVRA